jgi:hypothetical protein
MNKAGMTLVFVGNGAEPVAAFQYASKAESWGIQEYGVSRTDVSYRSGEIQWAKGIMAPPPAPEPVNTRCPDPPAHVLLEQINDELHIIRRMLGNPTAFMAGPEVMDILRMAVERVHNRYEEMAVDLRHKHEAENAEQPF